MDNKEYEVLYQSINTKFHLHLELIDNQSAKQYKNAAFLSPKVFSVHNLLLSSPCHSDTNNIINILKSTIMKKEMTVENMQQVINENITLVSDKTREAFNSLSVEDQYKKVLKLVANKKFQDKKKAGGAVVSAASGSKFDAAVKKVFEKYKPTIADAEGLIRYCYEYIEGCKAEEIDRITQEIERLTNMKNELMEAE